MELVNSMRNENSGVPAKLRTYAGPCTSNLAVVVYNEGGATIDLDSDTLRLSNKRDGYFVGGATPEITFSQADSDCRDYQRALGEIYMRMNGTGFMGVWAHDGLVYAEGSQWFETKSEALSVARERGQLAIHDVAGERDIFLTLP